MEFPKPTTDTGIGVHDDTNAYWKPAGFEEFVRNLREHGVTWYLLFVGDENKADFAEYLVRGGVMPILRMWPVKMPRAFMDMSVVEAYIAAGVKWIQCGNEFNLHEEWECETRWCGLDKPLRHIAEWYVRMADQIRGRGGWPLTPPPSLGGHMNHREWFKRFMTALNNIANEQGRTLESILYPGGIGLHCRSAGNPLEAGPDWYDVSAREWEWFDEVVKGYLGHSLPMANLEAFDEPQWIKPYIGSNYNWDLWRDRNLEQMRWFDPDNDGYRYPSYVFANCFWVYRDPNIWGWNHCALTENIIYDQQTGQGRETHLWKAMPSVITWQRREVEPPPPPEKARGIDVSAWQGAIDWTAVAGDGISFAYIRATQWDKETSSIVVDTYYERNQQAAAAAGVLRGAYHYLRADVAADRQARIFVDTIKDNDLELPPMLDVEESGLTQAQVELFVQTFKAITGQELGVYTSVWKWDQELRLVGKAGAGPLWVAHWTDADTPLLPKAWTTWEFWQHSNQGTVAGIQGRVDLDRFKGSETRLREKYEKPEPPPPPPAREFVGLSQAMIERLSFEPPADTSQPYWKAVKIEVQPYTNNSSAFAIVPVDHEPTVTFYWAGGQIQPEYKDDPYAPAGATVHAAAMPMYAVWGGYGCRLEGNTESVFGFGLYAQNLDITKAENHPVLIYWELVSPEPPPPPPDPADVIVPLAKEKLEGMPVPNDWALPAKAIEVGFPIQVGGYDRVEINGEIWVYQTFTRAAQDKYIVTYTKDGDWENVQWAEVITD